MQAPEQLHLFLGEGGAQWRGGGDGRPLAGDHIHVAFHDDQRGALPARMQQLARLGQAVQHPALVEERGLRPVQVLGAGLSIQRPPAERDHPAAPVQDREDDPFAEPVVRGAAVLGRNQQARLDQLRGVGSLGDEIVLQPRPLGRRVTQLEARPVILTQAPTLQIGPRLAPARPAQFALEPGGGRSQPVGEALALLVLLGSARILLGQGDAGLGRQPLDRFGERKPLGLLQEGDQVPVLAGREVEEVTLVVVDVERRRLLLGEGRQPDIFPPLPAQLDGAADHIGQPQA